MDCLLIPDSFESDGFCMIPAVLGPEEVASLIEDFEAQRATAKGHSLRNVHQSALVRETAMGRPVIDFARQILGPHARLARAIYFDKLPEANWSVPWHQDLTIAVSEKHEADGFGPWSQKDGAWHVQPPASILERMVTIRIHLDDCGIDNGPVRVKSGSHLYGRIKESEMEGWEASEKACVGASGSALIMRPLLLHASSPSKSPAHRRVLHMEYAGEDLPAPLSWYLKNESEAYLFEGQVRPVTPKP
jgi:ectoine hydroxylase-related dioxygenase (phytanoyl-CoA dioxygenase family)